MKFAILATLVLLMANVARAGSAQANIDCKSSSGKTTVQAIFPGDGPESGVIFSIEDKSVKYMDQSMKSFLELNQFIDSDYADAELALIQTRAELRKQKLTISVNAPDTKQLVFLLEVITGTAKVTKTTNGQRGTFKAKVQGVDPRTSSPSKLIEVSCAYRYEI